MSAGVPADLSPLREARSLFRWYRPYLRGMRGLIAWTITGTLVFLACVAVAPLLVEQILSNGTWDTGAIAALVAVVILELVTSHYARLGAHRVAAQSATTLAVRVFDRILASRIGRRELLDRSSAVGRTTSDVDRISAAVECTLAQGLPGIVRVLQSLILLAVIEPVAGAAMTAATLGFLLLHRHVGSRLIQADHHRLNENSVLSTLIDESISTSRVLSGLHLFDWQRRRFAAQVARLEHSIHAQSVHVTRLVVGAQTAGQVGLLVVTIGAVLLGGEDLAGVAASLLYVKGVVSGLEALPPWVRSVQLGIVAQHRIDVILSEPDRVTMPVGQSQAGGHRGPEARDLSVRLDSGTTLGGISLQLPQGSLVGVVASPWPLADALISVLAGDDDPAAGSVTLDGVDVRSQAIRRLIAFVSDETAGLDVSPWDELRAADPAIAEDDARRLLTTYGLAHVAERPGMLHASLGPGGNSLSVSDRQLLNLAVAVASSPRVLMAGSLIPLGEADSALPLVTALRTAGFESTVVSVRDPAVAEAVDLVLFLGGGRLVTGTHQDLLVAEPDYARIWERRLSGADVDLSVLGLAEADEAALFTRLVTESYAAGEPIYRQGTPADRLMFVISGEAAVTVTDAEGRERRTATLGPGNHCGDLSLTVGETRAESVWAVTPVVVRSLSREAISAGMTGLLDRSSTERRIVTSILRSGPASPDELRERLPDVQDSLFDSGLALLLRDGAVRRSDDGAIHAVQRRHVKAGAAAILDRLGGF